MFGIRFSPAALLGFEAMLAEKSAVVVDDIAKKLGSSEGDVHADETYWTLDGERAAGRLSDEQLPSEEFWIRERLSYLSQFTVAYPEAIILQGRINRHYTEWLIFVDDRRVPPTNNLAERALRPLVVLRKITFGHRNETGASTMAKLTTVAETARRHGHRASDIYFELYTRPPDQVMKRLYADASTPAK